MNSLKNLSADTVMSIFSYTSIFNTHTHTHTKKEMGEGLKETFFFFFEKEFMDFY